jgi:hypothetical protein
MAAPVATDNWSDGDFLCLSLNLTLLCPQQLGIGFDEVREQVRDEGQAGECPNCRGQSDDSSRSAGAKSPFAQPGKKHRRHNEYVDGAAEHAAKNRDGEWPDDFRSHLVAP